MEIIIGVIIGLIFLIGIFIPYIITPRYYFNKSDSETKALKESKAVVDATLAKIATDKATADAKAAADAKALADKAAADKAAADKIQANAKALIVANNQTDTLIPKSGSFINRLVDTGTAGAAQIRFDPNSIVGDVSGYDTTTISDTLSSNTPTLIQSGTEQNNDTTTTPNITSGTPNATTTPVGGSTTTPAAASEPATVDILEECKKSTPNALYDASKNYSVYGHASRQVFLNKEKDIKVTRTPNSEHPQCEYPVYIYNPILNQTDKWEKYDLIYDLPSIKSSADIPYEPINYFSTDYNPDLSNPKKFRSF